MSPARPIGVIVSAVLGALFVAWGFLFLRSYHPRGALWIDFAEYWAAGRLLLEGKNPYDGQLIAAIQQGFTDSRETVLMWNPPLVFPFSAPFALLDFPDARAAWILVLCGLMGFLAAGIISANLRSKSLFSGQRVPGVIYAILFPGFFYCFAYAQISPLLLLGLWGYWQLSRDQKGAGTRSFYAGAALSITLIKPHLLYLLYVFILLGAWRRKNILTLLGMGVGTALLGVLALLISPAVFEHYLEALASPPLYWQTPTLGSLFQGFSGIHSLSVRALPAMVSALVLAGLVILRKVPDSEASLAVIVSSSLLCAPYGWTYDHILMFPAMLWAIGKVSRDPCLFQLRWLIGGGAVMANLAGLLLPGEGMQSLVWYPAVNLLLVCLAAGFSGRAATLPA